MAHGCPIVTTYPSHPNPDLIDGQAMRMVPPDNASHLANVLEELGTDTSLSQQLGDNARQLAHQFTWDSIANQTVTFFEELIAQE